MANEFNRRAIILVDLLLDYCAETWGQPPCAATGTPCFNCYSGCGDTANFNKTSKVYRFSMAAAGPLRGLQLWPAIKGIKHIPTRINMASGFGRRDHITIALNDWIDDHLLTDPYHRARATTPCSFFAALKRRNKASAGRWMLLREGYENEDGTITVDEYSVRRYILDRIDGPNNFKATIVAKDILKLLDYINIPGETTGELVDAISADATSLALSAGTISQYLTDCGQGHFPTVNDPVYLSLEEEIVKVTGSQGTLLEAFDDSTDFTTSGTCVLSGDYTNYEEGIQGLQFGKSGPATSYSAYVFLAVSEDWSIYNYFQLLVAYHASGLEHLDAVEMRVADGAVRWAKYRFCDRADADLPDPAAGSSHIFFTPDDFTDLAAAVDWTDIKRYGFWGFCGGVWDAFDGFSHDNLRGIGSTFTLESANDRGARGTTAASHEEETRVQLCFHADGEKTYSEIWQEIQTLGGIDSTYINAVDADIEAARWLSTFLPDFCYPVPRKASERMKQLTRAGNTMTWWDAETQDTQLKAIRPASPGETVTILDEHGQLLRNVEITDREDLRISRVTIYFDPIDWSGNLWDIEDAPKNYRRIIHVIDASAEGSNEYAEQRSAYAIFAPMWPATLANELVSIGERIIFRLRDAPKDISLEVEGTDGAAISAGDLAKITIRTLVADDGSSLPTTFWVLSKLRQHGDSIVYSFDVRTDISQDVYRPGFWTSDTHPMWDNSDEAERKYGFWDTDGGSVIGSSWT